MREKVSINDTGRFDFEKFVDMLHFFAGSLEITKHKINANHTDVFIHHNQKKTYVVEFAYDLVLWFDGPPIKTTPGSEFSLVCNLLFEIITGIRDESLAGAINRFARSETRRNKDADEANLRTENALDDDVDNFYPINKVISNCEIEIKKLRHLYQDNSLGVYAKELISAKIKTNERRIIMNKNAYGPNIVWAHQAPNISFEKHWDWDATERKLTTLKIELGRLKRQMAQRH